MSMLIAAAPQLLDHPCCDVINRLPWGFFLFVHVALFVIGAFFASRAFASGNPLLAWGFAAFALAEVSYMTYHVNLTQFLFAHTISEVLDGAAFVAMFAAAVRGSLVTWSPGERAPNRRVASVP